MDRKYYLLGMTSSCVSEAYYDDLLGNTHLLSGNIVTCMVRVVLVCG